MDSDFKVQLRAYAGISPSEDREKVLLAVRNILGDCAYSVEEGDARVQVSSSDFRCLQKVRDQLRDRHVRDAARRLILRLQEGNRLNLLLNRQAAFAGVVALCTSQTESPLGPIRVGVDCDNPERLIDWLTAH